MSISLVQRPHELQFVMVEEISSSCHVRRCHHLVEILTYLVHWSKLQEVGAPDLLLCCLIQCPTCQAVAVSLLDLTCSGSATQDAGERCILAAYFVVQES